MAKKLKEERFYKSRIGNVYGPLAYNKKSKTFTAPIYGYVWNEKGKFLASPLFDHSNVVNHDNDLVKLARRKSRAKKKPKRRSLR